jgi:TPR repeat protein
LGEAFAKGNGVAVDYDEAEKWYRRAADAESLLAYYSLGRLYLRQRRYDDARDAFEFAAEKRYVPALHFLGRMHFAGNGMARDPEKGEQLLQRAADAGSVVAKAGLAQHLIRTGSSPSRKLRGVRLWLEARVSFIIVSLTEGMTSDRLR